MPDADDGDAEAVDQQAQQEGLPGEIGHNAEEEVEIEERADEGHVGDAADPRLRAERPGEQQDREADRDARRAEADPELPRHALVEDIPRAEADLRLEGDDLTKREAGEADQQQRQSPRHASGLAMAKRPGDWRALGDGGCRQVAFHQGRFLLSSGRHRRAPLWQRLPQISYSPRD